MATEALKSGSVTNADATPVVPNTAGAGAAAFMWTVNDYIAVSASMDVASTYKLVRLPSNAKLKQLIFESAALGAGKFHIGAYYSDSVTDGTPPSLQGTLIDVDYFATLVDCASKVGPTDVLNEADTVTLDKRKMPLWQMLGLSADPGGFIDIVATVNTTAITTGGLIGMLANFVW